MSAEKAQDIIKRAMADRAMYDAMAARESEVWGNILPARERSEARARDEAASGALRVARYQSSLTQLAREQELHFERGISLGCGAGRLERALVQSGTCGSIHGLDVSEKAVAEAREIAARENLSLTYEVADLNFITLPRKPSILSWRKLHFITFCFWKRWRNKRGRRSRPMAIFGSMISSARRRVSTIRNVWR